MAPKTHAWSTKDIPSLEGKLAIVTGATSGLGYETALALVGAGATVIVAGRNETKAITALANINAAYPNAKVSFGKVDLGSLASVKKFAEEFNSRNLALDILVNNAGLPHTPKQEKTSDGFELLFGTNHLAHFALTAHLLPSLRRSSNPRVVNVSSLAAREGKIDFDDLHSEKSYTGWGVYENSKLANLLFTNELQRRSDEAGWGLCVVSAHPGFSKTDIFDKMFGIRSIFNMLVMPFLSQSQSDGALPQIYAATSPEAQPGGYYGPQGFYELSGAVGPAFVPPTAKDTQVAKKLWDVSVELTGVQWS